MLNKSLILIAFLFSSLSYAQELCLYDANTDENLEGQQEIAECEGWTTYDGDTVLSCPLGRVECNLHNGGPVCPTNPTYQCTKSGEDDPYTCSDTLPSNTSPSHLFIDYVNGTAVINSIYHSGPPETYTPPEHCNIEYDQSASPHIVCASRRVNCGNENGQYVCPFNDDPSACTAPEYTSDYKCAVEELSCLEPTGNTEIIPLPIESYPSTPSASVMPDDEECQGQVMIFHGEPFSCLQAGVRSRWDNCCNNGNSIINDAMSNFWDGVINMVEGTEQMGNPNFMVDIMTALFYGLPDYHLMEAMVEVGNWMLTPCADDSYTAAMIANGLCVTVGDRCVEKLLGKCLQKKQVECCFASKLSRIIQEQGRPQLGIGWGTAKEPNCQGLTPEQFQSIDFSQIDLSEYIGDMEVKSQLEINQQINQSLADDIFEIENGGNGG